MSDAITLDPSSTTPAFGAAFERFTDSRPILDMLDMLAQTGRRNFAQKGA